jgi:hypothetical protein
VKVDAALTSSTTLLLFLIYINDLPKIINNNAEMFLFADDNSIIITSPGPINVKNCVNKDFRTYIGGSLLIYCH